MISRTKRDKAPVMIEKWLPLKIFPYLIERYALSFDFWSASSDCQTSQFLYLHISTLGISTLIMCKPLLGYEAEYTLTIVENAQTLIMPYLQTSVLVGWIKLEQKLLSDFEWDLISICFFPNIMMLMLKQKALLIF